MSTVLSAAQVITDLYTFTWIKLSLSVSLLPLPIPLSFFFLSLLCPVHHPRGHHAKDEIRSVSNPCRIGCLC